MSLTGYCKGFINDGYKITDKICTYEGGGGPYTDSCTGCLWSSNADLSGGVYCDEPGSNMGSKEKCNRDYGGFDGRFCWCPDPTPYTLAPTPTCKPCGMTCCGHGESCSYEAGGDPYCRGLTS